MMAELLVMTSFRVFQSSFNDVIGAYLRYSQVIVVECCAGLPPVFVVCPICGQIGEGSFSESGGVSAKCPSMADFPQFPTLSDGNGHEHMTKCFTELSTHGAVQNKIDGTVN